MKTEFTEVLTELIKTELPDLEPSRVNSLIETILNHTGRVDYRFKYEDLTWKYCELLEKIRKE